MKWSIEDFVYGATDGSVTTFAIVTGAFGASLPVAVIIILGFANLFADGFSMSIGNYLSVKTRREYIEKERKKEEWEIDNLAEQEKQIDAKTTTLIEKIVDALSATSETITNFTPLSPFSRLIRGGVQSVVDVVKKYKNSKS